MQKKYCTTLRQCRNLTTIASFFVLIQAIYSIFKLLESLFERCARGADIESHKASTLIAIGATFVERKVGLINKELYELLVLKVEVAAVEPYQK